MIPFAVGWYEISLFLHISAVVVGFGATFAEALTFPVAMKLSPRHLPYVHRLQLAINQWLAGPAIAIVLATGLYQVFEGDWDFGDFWISASLAIVIVIGALIGAYYVPEDRRLAGMAEEEIAAAGTGEIEMSEEYRRRSQREGIVGAITGLLVIVVIYLMVTKPGL